MKPIALCGVSRWSRSGGRAALLALLLASRSAVAEPEGAEPGPPPRFSAEVRFMMNVGGESLFDVMYSDGSTDTLTAGTYFSVALGGSAVPLRFGDEAIELALLAGVGGWNTDSTNTDGQLTLSRLFVDALAFYRHDLPRSFVALTAGGGATYHVLGGVSGSGSLDGLDVDLDNAPGWVAEVGATWAILRLSLRYTWLKIPIAGSGAELDGSSFGFAFSGVWPGTLRFKPAPAATR